MLSVNVVAACLALSMAEVPPVTNVWIDCEGVLTSRLGGQYIHASSQDPNEGDEVLAHSYRASHLPELPCAFAVRKGALWVVCGTTLGAGFQTERLSLTRRSSVQLCNGERPGMKTAREEECQAEKPRLDSKKASDGPSQFWISKPSEYEEQLPFFGAAKDARLSWIDVVPTGATSCVQFDLVNSEKEGNQLLVTEFDGTDPKKDIQVNKVVTLAAPFGGSFRAYIVDDTYYFLDRSGTLYVCDPAGKGKRKAVEKLDGLKHPVRVVVTNAKEKEEHYLFSFGDTTDEVVAFRLARKPKFVTCDREGAATRLRSKGELELAWHAIRELQESNVVPQPPSDK